MNPLLRPIEIARPASLEFGAGLVGRAGEWARARGRDAVVRRLGDKPAGQFGSLVSGAPDILLAAGTNLRSFGVARLKSAPQACRHGASRERRCQQLVARKRQAPEREIPLRLRLDGPMPAAFAHSTDAGSMT